MPESHVSPLLRELIDRTLNGELRWRRSTEDQVFSESIRGSRVVLTRRDQMGWALVAMQIAGHDGPRPIGNVTLTVHPLNEGGKVAEASIVVDSVRLPDHRPRLHDLWRYAQEAADAPVTAVVSLLRDLGANEAADEVLKGRKAATPLIAQAEEPRDDE